MNSIGCFLDNLGLAQSLASVDFIFYILDSRRGRWGPWPTPASHCVHVPKIITVGWQQTKISQQ